MNYNIKKCYIKLIILIIIIFLFYIINYFLNKKRIFEKYNNNNNKICCLYAYYEKNDLYKNNFKFFLENGILDDVDYYIIINGKCNVNIPKRDNIFIYNRENKGYDFGAFSYAIKHITQNYDYYFFINTSVCGPYLRNKNKKWTSYFIELFNDNVKVVGTSINICNFDRIKEYDLKKIYNKNKPFTHIQSMFFCINNDYFKYLKKINFFDEDKLNNNDMNYVIVTKELGLSQIALNNGWNINSILSKYKNLDYINLKEDINKTSLKGDPYFENKYFGKTIDKYEVIFFKTNRF